jgi:hypothetical protein
LWFKVSHFISAFKELAMILHGFKAYAYLVTTVL